MKSQEIAAKITAVAAQLAALQVQYDQAVLFESSVSVGNTVRFYSGRATEPDAPRPTKVGCIVGVGTGGNGNRIAKIQVGEGFEMELVSVRATEIIELVCVSATAADAADDAPDAAAE